MTMINDAMRKNRELCAKAQAALSKRRLSAEDMRRIAQMRYVPKDISEAEKKPSEV